MSFIFFSLGVNTSSSSYSLAGFTVSIFVFQSSFFAISPRILFPSEFNIPNF